MHDDRVASPHNVAALLRDAGLRPTPQRHAIVAYLLVHAPATFDDLAAGVLVEGRPLPRAILVRQLRALAPVIHSDPHGSYVCFALAIPNHPGGTP